MNNITDLKKNYFDNNYYYSNKNFLFKHSTTNLLNTLDLIKINFRKILIIQPGIDITCFKKNKINDYKEISYLDIEKQKENYDLIISNFSLHLEVAIEPLKYLNILNSILNKDGLLIISFLNDLSFRTFKKTLIEIDEYIFNGAYQRFGPFVNPQEIINLMSGNKFSEIVATNDCLDVYYKNLKNLRKDIKLTATGNYNLEKAKFNRNLLIKLQTIFEKLNNNGKCMPLEFEITTISAWK
ncbi:hypothetical protein OAQ08_01735 [Alphaproteobacteria bacterium]|nr:hypothetical protein [Alphaproteobacteria bacterium]